MSPPLLDRLLSGDTTPGADATQFTGYFDGEHLLVPLLAPEVPIITDQLKIALTLARVTGGHLSVLRPVSIPEQTPKTYHHEVIDDDDAALLNWALEQSADATPAVEGEFIPTRNPVRGLLRTINRQAIDTVVLPAGAQGGRFRTGVAQEIVAHAACDVVVVNGQAGYETVTSILLPIAGGPHSGFATDLAQVIAADCDAWIDILHVIDPDGSDRDRARAEELVEMAYHRIARPESTSTWMLEAADAAEAIVDQSQYYGLTVLGAPTKGRLRKLVFGSTNQTIRANARSTVLSASNNTE